MKPAARPKPLCLPGLLPPRLAAGLPGCAAALMGDGSRLAGGPGCGRGAAGLEESADRHRSSVMPLTHSNSNRTQLFRLSLLIPMTMVHATFGLRRQCQASTSLLLQRDDRRQQPALAMLTGSTHICNQAGMNWLHAHLPPALHLSAAGPATALRSIHASPPLAVAEKGCRWRQAPLLPRLPLRRECQHLE